MNYRQRQTTTHILVIILTLTLMACGSSGSSSSEESSETNTSGFSEIFSDVYSLTVSGAESDSCTVYGEYGRELGDGPPDNVTFEAGAEKSVIVSCGDLSAVTTIGVTSVTLTESTSVAADLLLGTSMRTGTLLIASLMADLDENAADTSLNASQSSFLRSFRSYLTAPDFGSELVQSALIDFVAAYDALEVIKTTTNSGTSDANCVADSTSNLIKLMVTMGQPVVVENVGSGLTMTSCDDTQAATFSTYAVSADASTVGMTGCLVYHSLDSVTDLNNSLGVPANNVPDSFRSVVTETGVITDIINAGYCSSETSFTLASMVNHVFTTLGHTAYTEDDEGVITTVTVSETDVNDYFSSVLLLDLDNWSIASDKFHTGYNPSGGVTYDVVAEDWESDFSNYTDDCYDWTGVLLSTCPLSPFTYDFDGTTLTSNASGQYILQLEWRGSGFIDSVYVVDKDTSRPYRDSNYQPVRVNLSDNGMSASTVNSIYHTNHLHDSDLDPLSDGSGNSAPWASSEWTALFPTYSSVINTNLYPAPEVTARLTFITYQSMHLGRLTALEAFVMSKMITSGMAAIPQSNGDYAILNDHGNTLTNWESLTSTWLQSGTAIKRLAGTATITISNKNKITFSKCAITSGSSASCTVLENNLVVDPNSGTVDSNGDTSFTLSGSLDVSSTDFGTVAYTPTTLRVSADGTLAYVEGAADLSFSFTGTNIASNIASSTRVKSTFTFIAVTE